MADNGIALNNIEALHAPYTVFHTNITNLMEVSSSSEAASCAATQEFPNIL
jgi:hypothetical protein